MSTFIRCGRFNLTLKRPLVMGIVNVTPDSFSDGNTHFETQQAIDHAHLLIEQGADILDIGGESTRPGSQAVDVSAELDRVMPVLEALIDSQIPISIDTCKPEVMAYAIDMGADMINDISGFRSSQAIDVVAANENVAVCLMHMLGEPRTMQQNPVYVDIVAEVHDYLLAGAQKLEAAGIQANRIVLDPGFGFGKTVEHNYTMLRELQQLMPKKYANLIGTSRKSMIGAITGRPANNRLGGSIATALAAVCRGANIIRVHDVAETVDAIRVWQTIEQEVTHG